uniref:Uncharacterized protein n=1 Tax=Amphimedon queenslandica TaxID=400682 RepID=A0A1X7SPN5_AMPQE
MFPPLHLILMSDFLPSPVSGIEESPVGTSRIARINSDINAASAILSDLSTDGIPPVCARDCRRLGRYRQDAPSPRSLLVTLNSTIEVSNVLSKCQRLPSHVSIRPDLSVSARKVRHIYLQERRKLIDAGLERKYIKLKKSGLYVSDQLFGTVTNNVFVVHKSLGELAPQLSQLLYNNNAQSSQSPDNSLSNTSAESSNPQSPLTLSPDTVSDSSSPHNSSSSPSSHSNAPLSVTSNPVSDGLPPSSSSS